MVSDPTKFFSSPGVASMSAADSGSSSSPFSFGVRLGITIIVEAAALSALAVVSLLLYILYSAVAIKRGATRTWTVSTHIHYYFVNLLVFDLIQAIGGLMDIKWVIDATVTEGMTCTVQGILKNMGDVGVALCTMAIALHTFVVLIVRWHPAPYIAPIVLVATWIIIALIVGISLATHKGKDYYGNTEYWCWITSNYGVQRIALEYLWMWFAAFINILCYVAMALVIKGVVSVSGTRVRLRPRSVSTTTSEFNIYAEGQSHSSAVSLHMLFYPLIYIVTVSPIAIVRWMAFDGKSVPFAATAFSDAVFALSGLFNVVLFTLTRPKLLPQREPHASSRYLRPYSTEMNSLNSPHSFTGRLPFCSLESGLTEDQKGPSRMAPVHLRALYTGMPYSGPVPSVCMCAPWIISSD